MTAAYHLSELRVEHFGGVRLVETELDPGLTLVAGKNGSGKSSLLAAVAALVNGARAMPAEPIHHGAQKAEAQGRLVGDDGTAYTVRLIQTEAGFRLTLEDEKGRVIRSPQETLDRLRGFAGIDPVGLAWEQDGRKVRDQLLRAVGVDVSAIDAHERALRDERTAVGRDVKRLAGALATMPGPESEPPAAPDTTEILARYEASRARAASKAELQAQAQRKHADAERAMVSAASLVDRVARLRIEADELEITAVATRETAEMADQEAAALEARASKVAVEDLGPIQECMAQAAQAHRALEQWEAKVQARARALEVEAAYDGLTEQIEAIGPRRAQALAASGLAVDGLEVAGEEVTLFGRPWAAASKGERLRTAILVRLASKSPLRLAWTQEGSALDEDNLTLVRELCAEHGLQLLVERTGTRDEGALVLVDGELGGVQ